MTSTPEKAIRSLPQSPLLQKSPQCVFFDMATAPALWAPMVWCGAWTAGEAVVGGKPGLQRSGFWNCSLRFSQPPNQLWKIQFRLLFRSHFSLHPLKWNRTDLERQRPPPTNVPSLHMGIAQAFRLWTENTAKTGCNYSVDNKYWMTRWC
jgi:hypothetical protein